jgi:hypothetical protein
MYYHPLPVPMLVPYAAPASPYNRLLLFAIRRMAAGGIDDAHAAHAIFTACGLAFRRPLILVRALMAEVARVASARLLVAPCCCPRMTDDEHALLTAIANANEDARGSHEAFCALLHVRQCLGIVTSAQAVSASFADLGMPLAVGGE